MERGGRGEEERREKREDGKKGERGEKESREKIARREVECVRERVHIWCEKLGDECGFHFAGTIQDFHFRSSPT